MFAPSRDQVRDFFFTTWGKYTRGEALAGAEATALQVILLHPEYHAILADRDRYLEQEYFPELGETNPFLHMSLHVAIEEQLAIDQPGGIRAAFAQIEARYTDRHAAQHALIECLAEMVWRAQRDARAPDGVAYLECARRLGGQ